MPSAQEVGRRLKEVRKEQGMTLKQVAQGSGMSPTHISEIERGKTSPTVGALRKIAGALGKETAYFVEEKPLPKVSVVKKEDRESVFLPGKGDTFINAKALTEGIPAGRITVNLIEQEKGGEMKLERHEGEEALVVLHGEAVATVSGEEFTVRNGDCLHYSGRLDRSIRFTGEGKNKALWVKVLPGAIRW